MGHCILSGIALDPELADLCAHLKLFLCPSVPKQCLSINLCCLLLCRPDPSGRRRIILSTPIAESSLTIEGVCIVVDSGYCRAPRYDVATGISRLHTVFISQSSADQRRGRAGRTGPGVCFR